MPDENETLESKINRNAEALRRVFEPLTVGLAPDVEPAVIYRLQPAIPEPKIYHDPS